MKLSFFAQDGRSTIVAGNIPALYGSNAFNSCVSISPTTVVNAQKVMGIMEMEKLLPAEDKTAIGAYVTFDIPAWATQIAVSMYDVETDGNSSILLEMSDAASSYAGTTYGGTASLASGANVAWSTIGNAILTSGIAESSYQFHGTVRISRAATANVWCLRSSISGVGTSVFANLLSSGSIETTTASAQLRLSINNLAEMFVGGSISVVYR